MSTTTSRPHRDVQQALEGNERVYFHTDEPLIAVWYGGPQITLYDSLTWSEVTTLTVSAGYRDVDVNGLEARVENRMAREGFDRNGRTNDKTMLVSRNRGRA